MSKRAQHFLATRAPSWTLGRAKIAILANRSRYRTLVGLVCRVVSPRFLLARRAISVTAACVFWLTQRPAHWWLHLPFLPKRKSFTGSAITTSGKKEIGIHQPISTGWFSLTCCIVMLVCFSLRIISSNRSDLDHPVPHRPSLRGEVVNKWLRTLLRGPNRWKEEEPVLRLSTI